MLQDLRIAVRSLGRNPVFSATAVAVLALGIGANSAIFGLVNQALFSPPGLSEPSRIVAVRARYVKLNLLSISLSGPDFRDVRDARDVFERTAVMRSGDVTYSTGGTPRVLAGARVSREWFDVFGARPLLGRTFVQEEDQPDAQRAVVLSHAAWVRVFGSDPGIVGQAVTIDDKPTRVVGVMPAEFRWPREVDIWLPLALPPQEFTEDFRFNEHLMGVSRLRPGISLAAANARISTLADRVCSTPGDTGALAKSSQWTMFALLFTDYVAGDSKLAMLVLQGAVGFVLLIACANIAGLMLARTTSRRREIAVRAAIGAGRWRLVRQTLAESAVLSTVGAALGIPLRKGRVFSDDDRLGTDPVVVIDENLAARYWPAQDPVGKRVRRGSSAPWMTIVGVVGHVLHTSLAGETDKGTYYACLYQRPVPGTSFAIRMQPGVAASAAAVIGAAVAGLDPTIPVQRASSMIERIDESLGPRRFVVWLLVFFAAAALLMAAIGLYGVISYSVTQRTQEIGVRMALGADRRSVVGLVLRQGAALTLAGVLAGAAGSAALSRLLASQLYNVSPFDAGTFAAMVGILAATALVATYIPARTASRVDPLTALRYE